MSWIEILQAVVLLINSVITVFQSKDIKKLKDGE